MKNHILLLINKITNEKNIKTTTSEELIELLELIELINMLNIHTITIYQGNCISLYNLV